jgi:hypothetical protein
MYDGVKGVGVVELVGLTSIWYSKVSVQEEGGYKIEYNSLCSGPKG